VVSHDRAFLDNVVTSTLVCESPGEWREYVGGYEDWLRQKPADVAPAPAKAERARPERAASRPKRAGFKERRELESLPGTIERLEAEQQRLFALMASPELYASRGGEVAETRRQLEAIEADLERAYARWLELETLASDPER
jgi:ATP-binding cassette subfamily F protein uup